jgi:hypothetical protein
MPRNDLMLLDPATPLAATGLANRAAVMVEEV